PKVITQSQSGSADDFYRHERQRPHSHSHAQHKAAAEKQNSCNNYYYHCSPTAVALHSSLVALRCLLFVAGWTLAGQGVKDVKGR
ncbi:unnamed protein product, partial [Ceratitis capitata]